ncbi:MAG: hypothetical protein M5U29_16020 [Anaerolineae bacterium]|nr:hypothetical protein [Anaerolineae bacterium]
MSARTRRAFRIAILAGWLIVALLIVAPALAQGEESTPPVEGGAPSSTPDDLSEAAARLVPLLVGAALIERTLEFIFAWSQRAALDATSSMRGIATRITGLVKVDFRQAYRQLDELSAALLRRQSAGVHAEYGDPTSEDPADWPLQQLEEHLTAVESLLTTTETKLKQILDSPLYKERKKMVAGVLSIIMGVLLAFATGLRLFEPLDVRVTGWFEGTFKIIDIVLAGVLMGLGTDWVHQVISVLTKGQRALGRAGESVKFDPEEIKNLAAEAIQEEFDAQWRALREHMQAEIAASVRSELEPG